MKIKITVDATQEEYDGWRAAAEAGEMPFEDWVKLALSDPTEILYIFTPAQKTRDEEERVAFERWEARRLAREEAERLEFMKGHTGLGALEEKRLRREGKL